ncbi:MAG: DUF5681 domain-containing protein [Bacteroidetes bacterium]|nr:DUF5681 domain-containing protein [Bacteroidota bacterium]
MPFKKGKSGNENGKPRGTKNKTGKQLRETISDFLSDNFEKVVGDFNSLKPKDRVKLYCDLLQYGLPKLSTVSLDKTESVSHPIIIDWTGQSKEDMLELERQIEKL